MPDELDLLIKKFENLVSDIKSNRDILSKRVDSLEGEISLIKEKLKVKEKTKADNKSNNKKKNFFSKILDSLAEEE